MSFRGFRKGKAVAIKDATLRVFFQSCDGLAPWGLVIPNPIQPHQRHPAIPTISNRYDNQDLLTQPTTDRTIDNSSIPQRCSPNDNRDYREGIEEYCDRQWEQETRKLGPATSEHEQLTATTTTQAHSPPAKPPNQQQIHHTALAIPGTWMNMNLRPR